MMANKRKLDRAVVLKRVGARIRELRVEQDLSQEALALQAGLDRSYLGGVERGERNISVANIVRIALAIGVTPAQLLEGAV